MPDVTLRNPTDTWANSTKTSKNYATASQLQMGGSTQYAYLFFNRAAPLGAVITSATLTLYRRGTATGSRTLTARRIASSWKASRLTWANKPGVLSGASPAATDAGTTDGSPVTINVTTLLQAVSDGGAWYGLRIESSDATARAWGSAQNLSQYKPSLTVSWSEAPDSPTQLSPSGGRVVAVAKPVLRCDFTDELGDTSMVALQVQTSTSTDFTTPAFDSGSVATDIPEYDLAPTAWAGFTSSLRYWRIRVQDGAGLWSPYSDPASALLVAKGTVTITNPAVSPNDFVSELTPPILWTFSLTQQAWQVRVWAASDPSTLLADSGKRTGTETSWTLPSGTFKSSTIGVTYVVEVRCWDTQNRETTPDVPIYASTTRSFTVSLSGATTAVSGLAAAADANAPRVVLSWTRATAPDSYLITRDGAAVEDDLAAVDALISGTSYQYIDDTALPWRSHQWNVRAVVNGIASSSTTVTATPKQRGIWLLDKGLGLTVWIAGADEGTWSLGEEASVVTPLNATSSMRRIQSQRGFEGSISGTLVDQYGVTALQYEAALLAMRANPTRVVTLSLADLSIRVLLGNIATWPTPQSPPLRRCSFDFWEQR
jgi:hypothetical protein